MASTVVRWLSHEFTVYEHSADWNEVPGLYIFAELLSGAEEWIAPLHWADRLFSYKASHS